MFANYDELNTVLESIKDGTFDSIDDLVEDYEITIKKLYSNMMESQRSVTIEAAASLDLVEDDYTHVINMIKKKYDLTHAYINLHKLSLFLTMEISASFLLHLLLKFKLLQVKMIHLHMKFLVLL